MGGGDAIICAMITHRASEDILACGTGALGNIAIHGNPTPLSFSPFSLSFALFLSFFSRLLFPFLFLYLSLSFLSLSPFFFLSSLPRHLN